jgi:pimeloyl-ACP methyl ester carboxylesterase
VQDVAVSDAIEPFRLDIPEEELEELRYRLVRTRWPSAEPVPDLTQGVPRSWLRDLCTYWTDEYDWRRLEARLNATGQWRTDLDGLGIHFLHVPSPEPDALPLLLTHGWPGSLVEFLDVVGPLADPRSHGGDPADAFDVVCPSLPGYGFSDVPEQPGWGVERIARAWATLMARLGYPRYAAQGGDWGSAVTTALANADPEHCAAIHLNLVFAFPGKGDTDMTETERKAIADVLEHQQWGTGYSQQQSTRPQTLGYGLADSPAGQAAWVLEKFWAWTDCDGDLYNVLTRDQLLDNVMLYWLPNTGASSARLYWESFRDRHRDPVETPTAVSVFPKEIFRPSRRWAERRYRDIRYWNEVERGGHFAAFEQPASFVDEVRAAFRTLLGPRG